MPLAQRELTERLFWLYRLRWLAALGIVGGTLGAVHVLHFPLPEGPLLATGLIVALYNSLLLAWTRALRPADGSLPPRVALLLAHLQIAVDLLALTAVIHFTGGVESPLGIYLVFHMIIAGILLPPRAAVFQAGLASGLYAGAVLLEGVGLLPHHALGFGPPGFARSFQAVYPVLALLSALFVSVFLATTIVQRLRRRERELSELTERLSQEQARTQAAYEQAQAAQLMQLHYMHRVSHELRRPLSSAASLLRVQLEGYGEHELDEQTAGMIRRALHRLQQGLDLVVDLLALSAAREAPLREARVWTDLGRLLEQVEDEQAEVARQAEVALEVETEAHLGPVWAQPEGLATVLRNLIGNALKYTPAGGQVRVTAHQDAQATYLTVADTGIGIPEEDLPRVFEEFFRGSEARDRDPGGTGLGLAIVKTIVEAHGGEVAVRRREGGGTVFEVALPHRYPETETETLTS
jgi:signal transduction histidine kinase